ncbi:FabD/lysophospholipase-like protein [Serendipita vermifera]|nr:FabD/lysophospholipase-like protein [Serendipita vermifera]
MSVKITHKDGVRILVLDGGDIRSFSQLDILNEFMARVQPGEDPIMNPCQYFHLIGGTGTGGLLAIFLGRLEMSIEEAKKAFIRLWGQAFLYDASEQSSSTLGSSNISFYAESAYIKRNSTRFEVVLGDILQEMKEWGFRRDMTLLCDSKEGYAKTLVCVSTVTGAEEHEFFTSYRIRETDIKISVIDAARATCAMPGWFSPVKIGEPRRTSEYVACQEPLTNPTEQVIDEAQKVFGAHQTVACILSIGSGVSALYHDEQPVPYRLSALTSSKCKIVDSNVFWRTNHKEVYYRFSVNRGLESSRELQISNLGKMIQDTKVYLSDHVVDDHMKQAVRRAESMAEVPLGSIGTLITPTKSLKYGLPSLDPSFVDRDRIMNEMEKAFFDEDYGCDEKGRRIMVLSGLEGCGKTQLVARFLRRYDERFRHFFFLNAKTESHIRQDLVKKVGSLGFKLNDQNELEAFQEALQVLQDASLAISREWVLIFDNYCDNPDIKLSTFFPRCDHGFIIVTTRNRLPGALTKGVHIEVAVMEEEEAHKVLIRSANIPIPPSRHRMWHVVNIARELEYLPSALVQAGSYIKRNDCLEDCLERLRQSPEAILTHGP